MGNCLKFVETARQASYSIDLDSIYAYKNTKFQNVLIAHSPIIGTFLALDGKIQSSESDYFIYHEAIVHPAMATLKDPRKVLVIGDGESAVVRELLFYKRIKIDHVELDREVYGLCKRHLPYSPKGEDKRVSTRFEDGIAFLRNSGGRYDLIISDVTEPEKSNPLSNTLYSRDFMQLAHDKLTDDGILVMENFTSLNNKWVSAASSSSPLREVFQIVRMMHFYMPSFGSDFGLVVASKRYDPVKTSRRQISDTIRGFRNGLFFYDEDTHDQLFSLSRLTKTHLLE